MADNVSYTPGSGVNIAADDVGGVLFQRVKIATGADGAAVDVNQDAPLPVAGQGELLEVLEALRMALHSIVKKLDGFTFDTGARIRVVYDSSSNLNTISALYRAGQFQFDMYPPMREMCQVPPSFIRNNITVS